ncbi:DNA topoisomerase IB [Aeromicrobium terrae]|uniref:DNA topoisomerase n=1 Tax=Aeromicrobium terrae TaxID=2498846 RepID=A0A5C8NNX0_9ACTN|nr:DNA topoisomerase IB [Aeromicrobium terrae]TXL62173.1 DNA topoisomerase IB [Aeromicrobium terrae]
MVRLRRVSASMPGWSRVAHGKGFRYLDEDGAPLPPLDRERCINLVIPPAWRDVWICPAENGHLQAVGTDDAGRRQYLYHPAWRERRDAEKFEHMERFARSLIRNRQVARREIGDEPDLTTVSAVAFSLLDLGMFRVGSDRYVDENGSHGLTTVERDHVTREGRGVTFCYPAKSGQEVEVTVRDDRVNAVLDMLRRRRSGGDRLFSYKHAGRWRHLTADDVNLYAKDTLGPEFTAKDFRTWRGTVIAAHALALSDASSKTARKRSITGAMREVSEHLGNTPAVARSSYVDPRVVDLFQDGITVAAGNRRISPGSPVSRTLERQVLRLLKKA